MAREPPPPVVFATERTYQRRGIGCLLMTAVKDVARLEVTLGLPTA